MDAGRQVGSGDEIEPDRSLDFSVSYKKDIFYKTLIFLGQVNLVRFAARIKISKKLFLHVIEQVT